MLVSAIALSMVLHVVLLYTPFLQSLFGIVPLNLNEWIAVTAISVPIIFIDEALKLVERNFFMVKLGEDKVARAKVE